VSLTFEYTDEDDNDYTYAKNLAVKVAP